jgi:hypothetical protein
MTIKHQELFDDEALPLRIRECHYNDRTRGTLSRIDWVEKIRRLEARRQARKYSEYGQKWIGAFAKALGLKEESL